MAGKEKVVSSAFDVDATVSDLVSRLKVADSAVKISVARQLGELHAVSAVDSLSGLLRDSSVLVRVEAVKSLSLVDSISSRRAIVFALSDENERVKTVAIEACGKLKISDSILNLIGFLSSFSLPRIRCAAAEALGELRDERAVKPLVALLKSEGHATRISAVEALGKIGGREVVQAMELHLNDGNSIVRREAVSILRKLKKE